MQTVNAIVSAILSQSGISIIEALKWLLLVPIFVLATIGVVIGLRWESEKFIPPVQRRGKKLLLVALAVETISGALAIGADGIISQSQNLEIIALQKQIAPRLLTTAQCAGIVKELTPFAGKATRIATYVADSEGSTLGQMIGVCLIAARLNVELGMASILPWGGFFAGVAVRGDDKALADAIRNALRTEGHLAVIDGSGIFAGNVAQGIDSAAAKSALIIVGVKPPAEMPEFK